MAGLVIESVLVSLESEMEGSHTLAALVRKDLEKLQIAVSALQKSKSILCNMKPDVKPTVTLNIGGTYAVINRLLFTNDKRQNFFKSLVAGSFDHLLPKDKNGRVFLDFDARWVEPYFNWLRDMAMWDGEKASEQPVMFISKSFSIIWMAAESHSFVGQYFGMESSNETADEIIVGCRVETNCGGKGRFYPGKVKQVRSDGTVDIDYDDGEFESRVAPDLVHLIGGGGGLARSSSPPRAARIEEGSKLEANYRGKGKYYPGKIKRDRGDGTFDIDYDDGEFEMRVPENMIRLLDGGGRVTLRSPVKSARIEEGSKVEANYRGKGKFYPGTVKQIRSDGTMDIDYNDGEFESRVSPDLVRLRDISPSRASARIEEGSKVEANYRGKGKYYPGKIKRDRGAGTFDIDYDDGEFESRVPEGRIRLLDGGAGGPLTSSARIEEGSKVEADYRGKGKHNTDTMKQTHGNSINNMYYDDGDFESIVPANMTRVTENNSGRGGNYAATDSVYCGVVGNGLHTVVGTAEQALAARISLTENIQAVLENIQEEHNVLWQEALGYKEQLMFVARHFGISYQSLLMMPETASEDDNQHHAFELVLYDIQVLSVLLSTAESSTNSSDPCNELVTISAGGRLVTTTKATLRQAPEGSMLANMASDAWGHDLDSDGNIYQDVNSELFVAVINHLRLKQLKACSGCNQTVPPIVVDERARNSLKHLLEYYMLTDLPVKYN